MYIVTNLQEFFSLMVLVIEDNFEMVPHCLFFLFRNDSQGVFRNGSSRFFEMIPPTQNLISALFKSPETYAFVSEAFS